MNDVTQGSPDVTPRREFFAQAGGAVALGLAAFAATPLRAQTPSSDWPGALKGRFRQVVDAYEVNSGFPLAFVFTFLMPNDPADTSALLVLRHGAFPIALNDAMWQKFKVGESLKINDPETKAPAVKNPFYKPKSGALPIDDMALDRLLAKGTIVGACNVALTVQSKMLSSNAGVTADAAAKEWAANIIPGVTVIPSGTWGVNRAQAPAADGREGATRGALVRSQIPASPRIAGAAATRTAGPADRSLGSGPFDPAPVSSRWTGIAKSGTLVGERLTPDLRHTGETRSRQN